MGILETEIVNAAVYVSEIESRGYFPDKLAALQVIIKSGGVGERLKPAVLKNQIAVLLSDRKFN